MRSFRRIAHVGAPRGAPASTMTIRPKILGQLLVEGGQIGVEVLDEALSGQRTPGERIGETLVRMGAANGTDIARALSHQLGLEFADHPLTVQPEAIRAVRSEIVQAYHVLPMALDSRTLTVAMSDPLDVAAVDDLQFQTGRRVVPVVASNHAVTSGIEVHYAEEMSDLLDALPENLRVSSEGVAVQLEARATGAPVVRLVDHLLTSAVDEGASDIHVEETGGDVRVRVRVDGRLKQSVDLPAASRRAVLSRLKVIAGMDISVRRRAQDGRIAIQHRGRGLTFRVSTLPVNGGEKAVVRVLDGQAAPRSLSSLGVSGADLSALRALVARGEGVILAAGPTGSGKSTTLFALLSEMDRDVQNVVTLEDPVEYALPGANQIQVDRRAGLGFADALRAILRQDPDVVMVGEIRDRETAEIAMAAAVTGHLVLSTIHAVDAPGAITRLLNMGVPPFLVAGGLSGVVAQRLVRRRCAFCHGRTCQDCDGGSRGRTGVYQLLALSDAMRDAIADGAPSGRLRQLAQDSGLRTLAADARRVVSAGLATPHEVARLILSGSDASQPCRRCRSPAPWGARGCPTCGHALGMRCACDRPVEPGWRFCPWCLERLPIRTPPSESSAH